MRIDGAPGGQSMQVEGAAGVKSSGAQSRAAPAGPAAAAQSVTGAVAEINHYLASVDHSLRFETDAATGKQVVRVVDTETHEVIRQIPSEEALAIARALSRSLRKFPAAG